MDKSLVLAAQRVVKKGLDSVAYNPTNRKLQSTVGVGSVLRKRILFNARDRLAIDKYFSQRLGTELRTVDLKNRDRLETASHVVEEKWASGTVFETLISIASTSPIKTAFGELITPPGCILSIPFEQMEFDSINSVVIVENGATITNWFKVEQALPDKYKGALIVYRGHGENQRHLKEIIQRVAVSANVCLYYDFDPAGLDMSIRVLNGRRADLAIPDCSVEELRKLNKPSAYNEQYEVLTSLLKSDNQTILSLARLFEKERLAVMQEKILVNDVPLKLASIN